MNPLYVVRFIIIYTIVLIIGFSIMKSNAEKRNRPKKKTQGRLVIPISSSYVGYDREMKDTRIFYSAKYQFVIDGVEYIKDFNVKTETPAQIVTIVYVNGVRDAELEGGQKQDNSISAKILYCILIAPAIATLISNFFDMLSYIV